MDQRETVILYGPSGKETAYECLDIISYRQDGYAVLRPMDGEDREIVILKIGDDHGHRKIYESVPDEEELSAVYNIFRKRTKNSF